jgi:NADPH:quinone reductase-like Zn-dependent oxidoreductase
MTFEEGATIGVAVVAAAEALLNALDLPWEPLLNPRPASSTEEKPVNEKPWLLIWGGATTTGMIATQLANQMGLRVIAVSSLHNAEYLYSNGAEIVLCRLKEEETVERIKEYGAEMGLDCVGAHTAGLAARALKEKGRLVCLVQPPKAVVPLQVSQLLIKRFHEDLGYGERLMALVTKLLESGRLKAPRLRIIGGGLAGIADGLNVMRKGEISGEKVVVRVAETPTVITATT